MPTFRLSIRLLDGAFHGRGDGGEPEWPPSPLRAFQALVNAAARRWQMNQFECYAGPALRWLEQLESPTVTAPPGRAATRPYRLYVPNNAGDLMVAAWARGNDEASMAEHRTEKDVRPTRFAGPGGRPLESNPDFLPVHYDWSLTPSQYEEGKTHEGTLKAAARSITHLGWGVDQAVGFAELLSTDPSTDPAAERWLPADAEGTVSLRVPQGGTLANLTEKHGAFLKRLSNESFRPVPPLSAFRVVGYRRATDPPGRAWVAFRIVSADPDSARNPAFDTPRRCRDVAAWVRKATEKVCQEWSDVASFVHGHDPDDNKKPLAGEKADERFMYLPLPTINRALNRVESIRRVLIAAPAEFRDRVEWVRRRLPGQELVAEEGGEVKGMLTDLKPDWVTGQYTGKSAVWSTVTPVVLPGYDDPDHVRRQLRDNRDATVQKHLLEQLDRRIDGLLRKAIRQAGFADRLADDAVLEWGSGGFRPGVDLVRHYLRPEKMNRFSAYHVRVRFPVAVRGPVAVGAGRYRGLGVFATDAG
jgi:CRISPR-associated protein Csb2